MDFALLNPFVLLRRIFWGKNLAEIIDFEKKRQELLDFFARTEVQVQKKVKRIEALTAQNLVHTTHMDQAKVLSDNLHTMMTQVIGAPAVVEPPASDEAV